MFGEGMIDPADLADKLVRLKTDRDFIMIYCPSCSKRVEFAVTHPTADGSHYQGINVPERIQQMMEWNPKDVICYDCKRYIKVRLTLAKTRPMDLTIELGAKLVAS
jgi:hypothetical protein